MKKIALCFALTLLLLAGCLGPAGLNIQEAMDKGYTYDQVVANYGPPDVKETVPGYLVCKWRDIGEPKAFFQDTRFSQPTQLICRFELATGRLQLVGWKIP